MNQDNLGARDYSLHQDSVVTGDFLQACAAGDMDARQRFQEEYGEDIYNFPVKIYGTPPEDAGDYYLYVFDRDRIFLRLRTFEGRNNIQFRTFLSYYVLKHLFLEWRRNRKEIDTISLQTPIADADHESRTLEDLLSDSVMSDSVSHDPTLMNGPTTIFNALAPEDWLHLKLLSLLEFHLSPDDVRLLVQLSGRTIHDTLTLLAEIYEDLKRKDEKVARLCDELDSVWGWIIMRQKELQDLSKKLCLLSTVENRFDTEKLMAQKQAREQALAKRLRQRERLVEELQKYKLTTPYKAIARLLNSTPSAVYSRICRLREQLARECSGHETLEGDTR
ncbi:MAG: hypothetical protein AB7G75_00360 [Candidatus Binatia bacterium]